jgi:hypothetical protein
MLSWADFYRGLANEATLRAAQMANSSEKDKIEEVAKERLMSSLFGQLPPSVSHFLQDYWLPLRLAFFSKPVALISELSTFNR